MATLDEFIASLVVNGERGGYESSNPTTGAYGKYQIMPTNWRNWSKVALATTSHPWIWAQLKLGRKPVADKSTPPLGWWPHPSRRNQDDVARWRLNLMWTKHNGDAQVVAAIWESGNGDRTQWTNRTIKYVNRVCVPLGYAEIPLLP